MQKTNYKEMILTIRKRLLGKHSQLSNTTDTYLKDTESFNLYNFNLQFVEKTYERIIEMENSNAVIINPLARLIEYPLYNTLNKSEKERYILKLSSLYLELKNKVKQTA